MAALTLPENTHSAPPEEPPTILYVGQHEPQRHDAVTPEFFHRAQDMGYDLLTAPITTTHFQSRVLAKLQEHIGCLGHSTNHAKIPMPLVSPLMPQDTDLTPEHGNPSIIATVSPWIDLSSPDPLIANISRQVLNLEVAYAAFCGISNILLHGPVSTPGCTQFSRAIHEVLGIGHYVQLHVLLPMAGELEEIVDGHLAELSRETYVEELFEDESEPHPYSAWETWNMIRTVCNYNTRLSIALEVPRQLPPSGLQSRWFSEPVRFLMLPRTSFLRNQKNFPVLSKQHQLYLSRLLRLRYPPALLLSDVGHIISAEPHLDSIGSPEPTPAEAANLTHEDAQDPALHLRYVRHLQHTQPSRPPIERFGQGYQDYLQSPLQPLADNLESMTYEVFEKDPIKYDWYENAIALALKDLKSKVGKRDIVVAVVGAGRGPLVTRVLLASRQTGVNVLCWAVEKNPNAHVLIQRRNAKDPLWNNRVKVVKSDMRSWQGPTVGDEAAKVDIFVSELLGSFADNELSPECLDGAQHLLHPDHGISIPQSYTAHLTPISAPRLYADILTRTSTDVSLNVRDKWEIPYVVMLHQYDNLSTQPTADEDVREPDVKEAWSFEHPAADSILQQARQRAGGSMDAGGWVGGDGNNEHNSRSCKLTFTCPDRGVCHGLGGYFETVLYATSDGATRVELSTNPVNMQEKSKDMISWFPIFFPLKTPLSVPDGAQLEVSMWRQTNDRKVWYEWMVEVYEQDDQGRRRHLGMSELHSSWKNGCLM